MLEKTVENYLVRQCKRYGGVAEKFTSPGKRGVPDRICSWPYGHKDWVECKAPDGCLKKDQVRDHIRRRNMGHSVFVCWSREDVDKYIADCIKRNEIHAIIKRASA